MAEKKKKNKETNKDYPSEAPGDSNGGNDNYNYDLLSGLLDLEDKYYQEGHSLGREDGIRAGHVEGKLFGVEKGYEKGLEMGRLCGRARVWSARFPPQPPTPPPPAAAAAVAAAVTPLVSDGVDSLPKLPDNARLRRHVELLQESADVATVVRENSDEAVADYDARMVKALGKEKVVASIVGESVELVRETDARASLQT